MTERPTDSEGGAPARVPPSTAPLFGWGIAAAGVLIAEALLVLCLARAFGAAYLLALLAVLLPLVVVAGLLVGRARSRAADSEQRHREADALAARQTALRRVATLVARGADPAESVGELARGLGVDNVTIVGFDPGPSCTVLAAYDEPGRVTTAVDERSPDDNGLADRIRHTGKPVRIDDGPGPQCAVGAPVTIDGDVRGALIVGSTRPLPSQAEDRVGDFAELLATAIVNAEARAELVASRARLAAAADQVRRGLERDLHDGVQQRIVALGLGLRTVEASVAPQEQAVRLQLDNVINGLADLYRHVQELSREIHPAALSSGGLGPALRALARRSALPVDLAVDVDRRLPEPVEVTAYHVVAEALTNAGKHSRASGVTIRAALGSDELHVCVADDGIGGATSADGGSGLMGLRDRVAAVSGQLTVLSPHDDGTTVAARFPLGSAESPG